MKMAAPKRKREKLSNISITKIQVKSRKTNIGRKIKYPTNLLVSLTIGWNIQRVPTRITTIERIEDTTGHHRKSISKPYEFLKVSIFLSWPFYYSWAKQQCQNNLCSNITHLNVSWSVPGSFKTPIDIRVTVSMIWNGASIATWTARMS